MDAASTAAEAHPARSLDAVLITSKLEGRAASKVDHRALAHAMQSLLHIWQDEQADVLQFLVKTAMKLCHAGSAGISLLAGKSPEEHFQWPAIAGAWASNVGGVMPLESPCGVVVRTNQVQLFAFPEHHFDYLAKVVQPIREALLAPFSLRGKVVGTLWVIVHDEDQRFDPEHARILINLSRFVAQAYEIMLLRERVKMLDARITGREQKYTRMLSDPDALLRDPPNVTSGAR